MLLNICDDMCGLLGDAWYNGSKQRCLFSRQHGQAAMLKHAAAHFAGLLQKKAQDGTQTTMEATLMAQQTPGQREQVRGSVCLRRAASS